jgi:uncharacterized membrane protein YccF (DUF307 family)
MEETTQRLVFGAETEQVPSPPAVAADRAALGETVPLVQPLQPALAVAPSAPAPQPIAPPSTQSTVVNVNVSATPVIIAVTASGPSFLVRAIWYLFIGWWLAGLAIGLGYFAAITVIGLPFAFYIFNRIPSILTLRARTQGISAEVQNGVTIVKMGTQQQLPMWMRALWFALVGWWAGAIWMSVAYALSLVIFTLPLGLMMFNRVGGVMTLLRY